MRSLILCGLLAISLPAPHNGHAHGAFRGAAAGALAPGPDDEHGNRPWRDDTIRFERLSNEQGLSVSVVYAIDQDPQGFLWFATQDGLNRYDGYTFKVYKHDPTQPGSLVVNWVNTLLVDRQGVLWVGTRGGGLDRFDRDTGTFIHHLHQQDNRYSLSSDNVTALFEDAGGNLWVGTDRGLDRLDASGSFLHLADAQGIPEDLKSAYVRSVRQDRSGSLWIATNKGLFRYLPHNPKEITGTFEVFQHDANIPGSLSSNNVSVILEDRFGRIWVATRGGGLDRLSFDRRNFTHLKAEPDGSGLSSDVIMDLYEDPDGVLWIATWEGGLNRIDSATGDITVYRNQPENTTSLSGDSLQTIFVDSSGLVWIGTFGGGLSKFDPAGEKFQHYISRPNEPNSLSGNMVWALKETRGILWIATNAGLDRFERSSGKFSHYLYTDDPNTGMPVGLVQTLFQDRLGRLWAGSQDGYLSRYDPINNQFKNFPITVDGPDGETIPVSIMSIAEDRRGRLWIGGQGDGLLRFDPRTAEVVPFPANELDPKTLSSKYVNVLTVAHEGGLWVGTNQGLNYVDSDTGYARRLPLTPDVGGAGENRRQPAIQAIYEDGEGVLWIGTSGDGLIRYQSRTREKRQYYSANGLPNDTVYGIMPDHLGRLWVSTNKGLSRFDPGAQTFTNFDAQDGLQSNEFNSNAYTKSADGELFFGGINGVTAFNPAKVHENAFVPPVVLTSLTQSGQPADLPAPVENIAAVTLQWPNNFFEFEFAGLSFRQAAQNRYAYKLEGFDRDWVYTGANRYGRYANLPGGNYTLRIKAANNDGVWNEAGTAIKITIVPPFWQTWAFRGGLVAALLLLAVGGYRVRMRSVEARNRALSRLVQERTHEIERRHQELEALYHADEALYRNIDLDDVLQALVDTAVHMLHADKGSLMVWDEQREKLSARATRGFHPETIPLLSFGPGEGVAGSVGISGQPAWVEDASQDARALRRITDREGISAFLQTPIKIGEEIFGVFSADYLSPRTFSEQDVRLLTSLAERAALAIQNAQIFEQTQAQAIVEERSRLARELHDAVTQTLFSASLLAEALPGVYETDLDEGRALLNELRQLSRGALAEMRTLLMELRPSALTEADLGDLLRQLGEAAAGRDGIPVTVHVDPPPSSEQPCQLPTDVHIALYRIAQEALNNAMKYARAEQISIELTRNAGQNGHMGETVSLTIEDNGRGFDPDRIPSNHFGLGIMRERAESVGAQFEVRSRIGAGTRITVRLNLDSINNIKSGGSNGAYISDTRRNC